MEELPLDGAACLPWSRLPQVHALTVLWIACLENGIDCQAHPSIPWPTKMPLCPCVETVHVTKGTVSTRGGIQEPTQDYRPGPARQLKSECGAQPSGSRAPAHRASAITVPRVTANRRAATRRLSCNSGPNGKIVWGRSVNGGRRMVEASDLALLFNNEVANVLAALRAWAAASTRFSVRARVTFLTRR